MSHYHFFTRWEVPATPEEVYRILEDIDALKAWWPSVYLDTKVLEKGRPGGVGKVVALYTKGWLPYTLLWKFRVTRADFPIGFTLEAEGDFEGTGVWEFSAKEDAGSCVVTYDWRIQARKPLLRRLGFLLRPLFSANHHWAMRKGIVSLELEIRRRKARSAAELSAIPRPPGPTFPHNRRKTRPLENV